MSKIEVNAVEPQCGTTLTLGGSGDTVALGTGASQSGFGRSGSVNWQTTIKTGDFTAVSGEGYFVNTTSGEIDVTLPSSPSAGDIVAVSDYAKTFDTNNCIMLRNSSNIEGAASNLTLDAEGIAMTFVYADSTKGWKVTGAGREVDATDTKFLTATGGTISTSGDDKIHTFTGPGTFTVTCAATCATQNIVSYMVVAGGGGGGRDRAGGGGAGGFRELKSPTTPYTASPLDGYPSSPNRVTVSATAYPITVGGGGTGGNTGPNVNGNDGNNSIFSTITATGGGGGHTSNVTPYAGNAGGSGGGGGGSVSGTGGAGNTPPVSPAQGTAGGTGQDGGNSRGAGGGGATVAGANASTSPSSATAGGAGATTSINGTPTARAGGGGSTGNPPITTAPGGAGGGGAGGNPAGTAGTTNTGGGGGGSHSAAGATGGSGIVIIRYKFQ